MRVGPWGLAACFLLSTRLSPRKERGGKIVATLTITNLSWGRETDSNSINVVLEGDGISIRLTDIYIRGEDLDKILAAQAAHENALRTLKGKQCTDCGENCNATIGRFDELRY